MRYAGRREVRLKQRVYGEEIVTVDKLDEPDTKLNFVCPDSEFRINSSLLTEKNDQRQFKGLTITLCVLLLHIIAIAAIDDLWIRSAPLIKKVSAPKIQSYLYHAPQKVPELEASIVNQVTLEQVSTANPSSISALVNAPTSGLNDQAKPPKAALSEPATSDISLQASLNRTAKSKSRTSSVNRFTQSYLAKQRASQLDSLVIERAAKYTQQRSLSEMDGDMQELVFPEVDTYSKVATTDHVLDPNRIIRKGDTCYRIVKIGDQINPYAETIGFPFNCGGDKVKKAINDAIAARLNKRMVGKQR